MLYKKIYFLGLAAYALSSIRNAAAYTVYAASHGNTAITCPNGESECIVHCNFQKWGNDVNCGNAPICILYPDEKQCFKDSIVNGTQSAQLIVHAGIASQPFANMIFNLPHNGNASFLSDPASNTPYQTITINAGTNTKEIYIDCTGGSTKDNCKKSTINAQTAEFLYIESSGTVLNGQDASNPTYINCPQNSPYSGPYDAPCYINADFGGSLDAIVIDTLWGYPRDVFLNVIEANLQDVILQCTDGTDTENTLFVENNRVCYNTKAPTLFPTRSPTHDPTHDPTQPPTHHPTQSPTPLPTSIPTHMPSQYPTLHPTPMPSNYPTEHPTKNPTQDPTINTQDPTAVPSKQPANIPTNKPMYILQMSNEPTPNPIIFPTESSISTTLDENDDTESNTALWILDKLPLLIIIGVANVIVCICFVIVLWYLAKRKKSKRKSGKVHSKMKPSMSEVQSTSVFQKRDAMHGKLVQKWLREKVELPEYVDTFYENGYETILAVIKIKNKQDLIEIGITKIGHQSQLLAEIEKLRRIAKGKKRKKRQQRRAVNNRNNVRIRPLNAGFGGKLNSRNALAPMPAMVHIQSLSTKPEVKVFVEEDGDDGDIDEDDDVMQNIYDLISGKGETARGDDVRVDGAVLNEGEFIVRDDNAYEETPDEDHADHDAIIPQMTLRDSEFIVRDDNEETPDEDHSDHDTIIPQMTLRNSEELDVERDEGTETEEYINNIGDDDNDIISPMTLGDSEALDVERDARTETEEYINDDDNDVIVGSVNTIGF